MLLRASARFRRQYACVLEKQDPPVQPFPQTWNLDVISHGRAQLLVLASEECSLFSFLIPTTRERKFERFLSEFRVRLLQLFENVGTRLADRPELNQVTLVGRTDRRIIGSQTDLLFITKAFLSESEKPASYATLRDIEEHLNAVPMSYLAMGSPLEALRRKTASLEAS